MNTGMNSNTNGPHIHGITCDVTNCYYNKQEACTAEQIKVGPQYAASSAETVCVTFRPQ